MLVLSLTPGHLASCLKFFLGEARKMNWMNHAQTGTEGGEFRGKSKPTYKADHIPLRNPAVHPLPDPEPSPRGASLGDGSGVLRCAETGENPGAPRISQAHDNSNRLRYVRKAMAADGVILTPGEQAWWHLSCPRFLAAEKENMNRYVDYRILADVGLWTPSQEG